MPVISQKKKYICIDLIFLYYAGFKFRNNVWEEFNNKRTTIKQKTSNFKIVSDALIYKRKEAFYS